MDYRMSGLTAFVSSGAHGIGQATADLLTQEGASVIVADVDAAALEQNGKRWHGTVAADLSTAEGMARAIPPRFKAIWRRARYSDQQLGRRRYGRI